MNALLEQVCLEFQLDLSSRMCSGWCPVSGEWLEWWVLDLSGFADQVSDLGFVFWKMRISCFLRMSSPLEFQEL